MVIRQNKHIIKLGEKLADIERIYGLSKNDIVLFHNNNTEQNNHILFDITNQKELIIPRKAVEDKTKLVKFSGENAFVFLPQNSNYQYGVSVRIENGDRQNELKYEVSVKWLKFENKLHYFEVDRTSKIFINEEEVNEIADLLAYKTSKVLYPLQISIDENGKFYAVENTEVFKDRLNGVKDDVYNEFEGEIVDEYLLKIEEVINNPEILTLLLRNDFFLRTLFFGVYRKFGKNYETIFQDGFPIVENAVEPNYEIKLEIDPVLDDYDLVYIEGNGLLRDERTRSDFLSQSPFSFIIEDNAKYNDEGRIRLSYYMNSKTGLSEAIYLECSLQLEHEKKISVSIVNLKEDEKK